MNTYQKKKKRIDGLHILLGCFKYRTYIILKDFTLYRDANNLGMTIVVLYID